MPKRLPRPPKYCLHKSTGQAFVLVKGKPKYLGKFGTEESAKAYAQFLTWWKEEQEAAARQEADEQTAFEVCRAADLEVQELLAAFWTHAEQHYRKHGEPTRTLDNLRQALRPLAALYAELPAREFGPLKLKALRERMLEKRMGDGRRLSRKVINERIRIIVSVFKWAVSEQLIPETIYRALTTVQGLRAGRSQARETVPVPPVSEHVIALTLPHLPPVVADMVRFQRLTGCRPGEVCSLRPCDVTRSVEVETPLPLFDPRAAKSPPRRPLDVWEYRPARHKTEHHGRQRVVLIGPRAQQILAPYLLRDNEAFCFSPAESEARRHEQQRAERKTPVQPSQRDRRKPVPRQLRDRYTKDAYNRAVARACDKAFPPPEEMTAAEEIRQWKRKHRWAPNQLRHAAATEIRKRFGAEAAQVVLGHAKLNTTEIYAERDQTAAARIIGEVG